MFYFRFEATPRRDARVAPEAAGAFVSCWIERSTLQEAVRVARAGIEQQGWIVDQPEESREVTLKDYPAGHNGREQFEQALIDKEVFVFFTYPESE
jgi:hypothetical protein